VSEELSNSVMMGYVRRKSRGVSSDAL